MKKDPLNSKILNMDKQIQMYIIAGLSVVALVTILILISNTKKTSTKKKIDDLYVRFNTIKTTPLAFKLNKAQMMAKRNEETANSVQEYYNKYEQTEIKIGGIQELLNQIDDAYAAKDYKQVNKLLEDAIIKTKECEDDVKNIDEFLSNFSKKENEQREQSTNLKEEYRLIKNAVNANSNTLSISYEGILKILGECEELFTASEEWMYTNDYISAEECLTNIQDILDKLKENVVEIPELIKDTKGVLPIMIDEAKREYALTRQRGVYIEHLDVDNKLDGIEKNLNEDLKSLMNAEIINVKEHVSNSKDVLNELMDAFERENRAFKETQEENEKVLSNISDLVEIENYVRIAYDKDSARFGLENLRDILKQKRDAIESYREHYKTISVDINSCIKPATDLLDEVIEFSKQVENDKKELYSYKTTIDKSTDGEVRAKAQLIKLQLVVNEVETKVEEYHLPSISTTYTEDLLKARIYIDKIKELLKEIPIDIDNLNNVLNEAIDFVYKFYNNVNNIVGVAIMVENAIVFGNKYRSTFAEIDQGLSKAEFQYLNGEYTKALKTAISCMEQLFPENADQKILESV